MTLVQKLFYFKKIYGIDSRTSYIKTHQIMKYIINQLKFQRQLFSSTPNNNELLKVGEKIQNAIEQLQHPNNCSESPILVCQLDDYCSFGVAMHHISYCLSIASGIGRTLIYKDNKAWTYNATWEEMFKNISRCNYDQHVKPFLSDSAVYSSSEQLKRILFLRNRDEMYLLNKTELPQIPEAVPKSLEHFLRKYHSNPPAWFQGQLFKYAWKLTENLELKVRQAYAQIPFECGPVIGISHRRTDKYVNSRFFKLDEYILSILEELVQHIKKRRTKEALIELNSDIFILSKCQFVVCTFSNNICRIVYELMQTFGDATDKVHSMDYFYAEHSQNIKMVAIADYFPQQDRSIIQEEISLKKGDIIEVTGPIQNDGFVNGRKLLNDFPQNINKIPIYLLRNHYLSANFTNFMNIELN
ncbi:GT23 domain-containing protein [Meloidogyne graminicola]|uniref:GT23 domain-containing protein n=1 Tax=Meloidogyne graminicola TaxID=189291 RepID=A0A8S9ZJX2_9BILA|nr:GT23 domain-containing protein [Meloidogyne graminicola]